MIAGIFNRKNSVSWQVSTRIGISDFLGLHFAESYRLLERKNNFQSFFFFLQADNWTWVKILHSFFLDPCIFENVSIAEALCYKVLMCSLDLCNCGSLMFWYAEPCFHKKGCRGKSVPCGDTLCTPNKDSWVQVTSTEREGGAGVRFPLVDLGWPLLCLSRRDLRGRKETQSNLLPLVFPTHHPK